MAKLDSGFLDKFLQTTSVSGIEFRAQKLWLDHIKDYCDATDTDKIGNALGIVNKKAEYSVLVTAHCDEIGFMVSNIDDEGFIHVIQIGDYHPQAIPGSILTIFSSKGLVEGVFGIKTSHMSEQDEMSKINKLPDLWVDIGAKDKKDAEKRVCVGDIAVIKNTPRLNNDFLTAPGLDDKIGVYAVGEILRAVSKSKLNVKVVGASTVHEEITSGGIQAVYEKYNFNAAIFIDVGFASDFPGNNKNKWGNIKLGSGPIISSASTINPVLRKTLIETAAKKKIPFQYFAEGSRTGTDLEKTYHKTPSALISIPCRYMHTPVETVHSTDILNLVALCSEFIKGLKGKETFDPFEK